ncbi:alpha/beta fold hydrolase [Gynuella sunshinyii]|uniref:Putative hydrolase or acyltransferase (Alpha/beta hydrolase superfamily) n=1 Tax=Gynuella sunshinyii YC6258 TaxID=1445510 RepID=A0A0C5W2E8_9GAMM|nr:alpha/beta hydrolase [Gynuella sunshinyii]AJQ96849.1 putative hydrolase or acyltransferase (alpha/beta hydrolase superfamily) [Gynuella sunshinyii YC6258]
MEIDYLNAGSGELIVLVHGALADKRMWIPHMNLLQDKYEVLSLTQRHFDGQSQGPFGLNTHAQDLAEFLGNQFSTHSRIHLIGWSYGADVVLNTLTQHALPVSSAMVYEPGFPGCVNETDMALLGSDAQQMFGPVFSAVAEGQLDKAVEALIDGSGNQTGYFHSQPEVLKKQQLELANTLPLQLDRSEFPKLDEIALGNLDIPVTVAFGSRTRSLFGVVSKSVHHAIPGSQLCEIEGANHMLPLESPDKFTTIISEHMERIQR